MSDSHLLDDDSTVGLQDALEERYLAYALSTIVNRALPDVRDGLKPVQRRILYAMRQLKLDPENSPKKSARVVGDVIGRFHPHGEQSIYDALVRLAQDFSQRYPLVNGQGNFGNVDGDNAAAMRYTEARLTEVARLMLDGLGADTVDFRDTYDEEDEEPVVLPGAFPNLLANGTAGIAVGMATNIPPHNAAELAEGALMLIDKPSTSTAELVEVIKGPDFPTGGVIVDEASTITEAYETGRGGFRVRARWMTEDLGRGQWQIVITEIPYQVQKSKLIERIATLLMERKLTMLADVRDESAEDIRVILEPKSRTVNPTLLMETLFRLTELEQRASLNLNVLRNGQVPEVMSLKQALRHWLEHQREVLVRRSRHRLAQIERRLEVLAGLLIAYLNIDEVIRIIRFEENPKEMLVEKFKLTEVQVEAILNMRLRALNKLEEITIKEEHEKLSTEKDELEALIGSDRKQWSRVRQSVKTLGKTFGQDTELGKRRTQFQKAPTTAKEDIMEAMVEREPITIILSTMGWLRAAKGHSDDHSKLSFKAGDELQLAIKAQTTDKLILLSSDGKFYTLGADRLPGGRSQGEPVRLMVDIDEEATIVTAFIHQAGRKLVLAARSGRGFVVPENDVIANTKKGKQIMTVGKEDQVVYAVTCRGDHLAVLGENRKLLIFPLSELPEMKRGRGVKLQRYKNGALADLTCLTLADGLIWKDKSDRNWTVTELGEWKGNRASAGRTPPKGFPRDNRFFPKTLVD